MLILGFKPLKKACKVEISTKNTCGKLSTGVLKFDDCLAAFIHKVM